MLTDKYCVRIVQLIFRDLAQYATHDFPRARFWQSGSPLDYVRFGNRPDLGGVGMEPETARSTGPWGLPHEGLVRDFLGSPADPVEPPTPSQRILFGDARRRVPRWFDPDLVRLRVLSHAASS